MCALQRDARCSLVHLHTEHLQQLCTGKCNQVLSLRAPALLSVRALTHAVPHFASQAAATEAAHVWPAGALSTKLVSCALPTNMLKCCCCCSSIQLTRVPPSRAFMSCGRRSVGRRPPGSGTCREARDQSRRGRLPRLRRWARPYGAPAGGPHPCSAGRRQSWRPC